MSTATLSARTPLVVSLVFVGLAFALGADDPKGKAGDEPSFEVKPSPEHKLLSKELGVWDGTMKMYMGGPDAEPMVSKGVETNTLMTGGLWVVSSFKGEFAGKPFEGTGVTGFNPMKKKYVGTWADSMAPEITLMEGTYDEATKTMTMTAKGTGEDGKPMDMKFLSQFKSDDEKLFTLQMKSEATGGTWIKMMEIAYKRRAK